MRFCRNKIGPREVSLIAAAMIKRHGRQHRQQRQASQNVDHPLRGAAQPVRLLALLEIGVKGWVAGALHILILRIPVVRENVEGKLDAAELFGVELVAQHRADPGKNRAEHCIVVQNDLGEHDSHHGVCRVPAGNVGFTGRPLERGKHVQQDAALLVTRVITPGVDQQKHERTLRTLAAPSLQRDHPVKCSFAQHFAGFHTALRR